MKAVVVYESMFGNTRRVATAIAEGLGPAGEVVVVPVGEVTPAVWGDADLLVVGGPTHVHGMSGPRSRQAADEMARKPGSGVAFEPGAEAAGLREWLAGRPDLATAVAAFDTRMHGPAFFTGRASRRILRSLKRLGGRPVAAPESFFVTRASLLDAGECERARQWGVGLAASVPGRVSVKT